MDSKTPFVSVIIPTYNRAKLVSQAIDSALNQTYKNMEIIVIDDGSADNTKEAVSRYQSKIRYIYKENGGASSARNLGIKEAKGSYIAFLDSDDLWLPGKVEKQMNQLRLNKGYSFAISDIEFIDDDNKHLAFSNLRKTITKDGFIFADALKIPTITSSYMLIDREVFGNVGLFDETINTAEDIDMMLRICNRYKTILIEEPLVKYRKNKDSLSNQLFTKNRLKVLDKIPQYADNIKNEHRRIISRTKVRVHLNYAADLLWSRHFKEARSQIAESMAIHVTFKAFVLYIKSLIVQLFYYITPKDKAKGKLDGKINLLYVNYSFDIGGIETLILDICRVLDKGKYNVSICSFHKNNYLESEFKLMGVPLYILEKKPGIDISLIFRLRRLSKEINADIIHTHNAAQWFYGALACLGIKKPVVIHTQHSELKKDKKTLLASLRFLSKKTHSVVGVAEALSDYLANSGRINKKKIRVVYNGIDTEKFNIKIDADRKKESLGIRKDYLTIGIIARLVPNKDHKNIIDAFKIVCETFGNVQLVIVGDGGLRDGLIKYAKDIEIGKQIYFLGNRRDIPELFKIFDIFVLSSLIEGLPVTILEAMAAGLSVVATDVGGNREVVIDNYNGFLVPPKDSRRLAEAICVILRDESRRKKLGENARRMVRAKFDFNRMVKEYSDLYESCVRQ